MQHKFGIHPFTTPKLWWGARAIANRNGIDIPWDRQNFEGDKANASDFIQWINDIAIPALDKYVKKGQTKGIVIDSDDGVYHCEADDESSGGYLYIGVWTTEN